MAEMADSGRQRTEQAAGHVGLEVEDAQGIKRGALVVSVCHPAMLVGWRRRRGRAKLDFFYF